MRVCTTCQEPKVTTTHGRPVCDGCRKRGNVQRRTCIHCGASFATKASTTQCGSCSHQRSKRPCRTCGEMVDRRSEQCRTCWGAEHGGASNPNWGGGRTMHVAHGYVKLKTPGHPRADSQGYVREHVLVMEEVIGRFLLPGENVHHRNGVRDDNRPENLELWTVAQPAGQRAADLLAWAREVIARYEPIEAALTVAEEVTA